MRKVVGPGRDTREKFVRRLKAAGDLVIKGRKRWLEPGGKGPGCILQRALGDDDVDADTSLLRDKIQNRYEIVMPMDVVEDLTMANDALDPDEMDREDRPEAISRFKAAIGRMVKMMEQG